MTTPPPDRRETIGPYRIKGTLGRGGMGVVYKGEHERTGALAAIKTVRLAKEVELDSLRREVHALSRIKHPGVVSILDQGVEAGLPWYAMELLIGQTLGDYQRALWPPVRYQDTPATRLVGASGTESPPPGTPPQINVETVKQSADSRTSDAPPLAREAPRDRAVAGAGRLEEVLRLVAAICAPLAFLHRSGVVHRDIKPDNVFLRDDRSPVLVDFGVVSHFGGATGRDVLEVGGATVGTPLYMAPEQISGQYVDARADLYALGCLLYELLTGRHPFARAASVNVFYAHLHEIPVRPSELAHGVPPDVDELVLRLLAKKPRDRIGYAEDVAEVLCVALGESGDYPKDRAVDVHLYRPELVGRSALLADLKERLTKATQGEGELVLFSGESGVGKTRILRELASLGARADLRVVTGECASGADAKGSGPLAAPLHPFRQLLLFTGDRARELGLVETQRLFRGRLKILAAHEPSLLSLPGAEDEPAPAPLPADAARHRLLDALGGLIRELATGAPLLLILDDLQWADELSLAFLRRLTPDFFAGQTLIVAAAYRSEEGAAVREIGRTTGAHEVSLARLEAAELGAVTAGLLALREVPPSLVEFLHAQSEGNPFFLTEYVRAAVEEGVLVRARGGRWELSDDRVAPTVSVPRSIEALVARRFRALSEPALELLRLAAVLGRELDQQTLFEVSGLDEASALDALAELVARQILEDQRGRLGFAHDKLRELAYASIGDQPKARLHRGVALALEARTGAGEAPLRLPVLAHHFLLGGVQAKAIDYLEESGDHALRSGASREAMSYLERAIELEGKKSQNALRRARWERWLADATFDAGDLKASVAHATRALEALGHPAPGDDEKAWSLAGLWQLGVQAAHRLKPKAWVAEGETRLHYAEASLAAAKLSTAYIFLSDQKRMMVTALLATNLGDRAGELAYAGPPAALGLMTGFLGLRKLSDGYFKRSRTLAEAAKDPLGLLDLLLSESVFAHGAAEWERTFELLRAGLSLAERIGHRRYWELFQMSHATASWLTGDIPGALDALAAIGQSARGRGAAMHEVWSNLATAGCWTTQGRSLDATALLEATREKLPALNDLVGQATCETLLSVNRGRAGDHEASLATGERALELLERGPPTNFGAYTTYTRLPEVFLAAWEDAVSRKDPRAKELQKKALACCEHVAKYGRLYPMGRPAALVHRGRAERVAGKARRARKTLETALATARALGMPHEEGLAELELARLSGPDSAQRDEHARRAESTFQKMGVDPHRAEARALRGA